MSQDHFKGGKSHQKKGKLSLKTWNNFENNDNGSFILSKLNEDRTRNGCFCDFTIKTETHEFPVHKCLLGVMSDFFKNMFTSNMREKFENCATLEGNAEIVSMVIEFIYNNPISITMENVYELLESADFLQISLLQNHCIKFLTNHLSPESVLRTWEYAKSYNMDDLLSHCEKFLMKNMSSFIGLKKHLNLEIEIYEHFIRIRGNTTEERLIFESIVEWVQYDKPNRQEYFSRLFALIDLNKLSKQYLNTEVSTNDLVLQCHESSKLLLKSMRSHLTEPDSASSHSTGQFSYAAEACHSFAQANIPETKLNSEHQQYDFEPTTKLNSPQKPMKTKDRKQQQNLALLLVGGNSSQNTVRKCNIFTKKWNNVLTSINKNLFSGVITLHGATFVIGGCDNESLNAFDKVECFHNINVSTECVHKSPLKQKRYKFGCAVFRNQIYVAGGYSHKTGLLSSVESYNVTKDHWIERQGMNFRRAGFGLVQNGGLLYAVGGKENSKSFLNSMEQFDGSNWKLAVPMGVARCDHAVVVLGGLIYAIGGEGKPSYFLKFVERYDPKQQSWRPVANLNIPRAEHCACAIAGKIYVVGGRNHKGHVTAMEMYDPNSDKWEIVRDIREDLSGAAMAIWPVHK